MPLHLNILEKIGLLGFNQGPAPIIDILEMLSFKAVMSAQRLGIFDDIAEGGRSAANIAASAGLDPMGVSILLELLVNLGYLKRRNGYYRNTRSTRKWLLTSSRNSIAGLFRQFNDMACRWDYLDSTIRNGIPPIMGWEWLDQEPERWHAYHAGLKSSAILICRELMKKVTLPAGATRLIDLGGSHGQYCIEFCRRYQHISGVVYDWAPAQKTAIENIESSGMQDRISFKPGDFMEDSLGDPYDVVLLFNVIRIFKHEELKTLLKKIHGSMNQGGMVIIMDHLGHTPGSRLMKANSLILLLELYNSTAGKTHHKDDVSLWLAECGFTSIRDTMLKRSPGLGIITARRS